MEQRKRLQAVEYTLYCDESTSKDRKYGDFFGGCIIEAHDLQPVVQALEKCKRDNNLFGEIKWTKLTDTYLEKYQNVIRLFFDYVRQGKIRVRIMFREIDNQYTAYSKDEKYFKLYYQFIKHGFGFTHTQGLSPFNVRIYLDQLPAKKEDTRRFKDFLANMPNTNDFKGCALRVPQEQIAEVRSHDHVLLQCVDIIMGAMQFRLNNHHKDIPQGSRRRGKKTVAKEKLYKCIHKEICTIHPVFNIGLSTGARGYQNPHWESPYEHWLFCPNKPED